MSEFKMVIGLGNPGKRYAGTRHNIGFRVVDALADELKIDVKRKKFGALTGIGDFEGHKLILFKPLSFMNLSGQPVATAVGFYKMEKTDLLVVTDDMDLEPGKVRLRAKGSSGGHKGLADIMEKLGTEEIPRLRVGIGSSRERGTGAVDFVLDVPPAEERKILEDVIYRSKDAVICWLRHGCRRAMNEFN